MVKKFLFMVLSVVLIVLLFEAIQLSNIIGDYKNESLKLPRLLVRQYLQVYQENHDYKLIIDKALARNIVIDLHPDHPGFDVTLTSSLAISYLVIIFSNDEDKIRAFLMLNLKGEYIDEKADISVYYSVINQRFPFREIYNVKKQ